VAKSYTDIISQISSQHPLISAKTALFVTDNILEADAAKEAGLHVVMTIRPGNKDLPEGHTHRTAQTFDKLFETFTFVVPKVVAATID